MKHYSKPRTVADLLSLQIALATACDALTEETGFCPGELSSFTRKIEETIIEQRQKRTPFPAFLIHDGKVVSVYKDETRGIDISTYDCADAAAMKILP